jgi:cell division protein FtsQ
LPLGSPLAELKLSPRGAWQVVLESGLVLELGRIDRVARLERFAAAWPRLALHDPAPRYADLRYPNGFALRVKNAK